jgi:hypothetical protein
LLKIPENPHGDTVDQLVEIEVIDMFFNIEERCSSASPEYQSFYQQTVQTNYERALDELKRLVVMRLFALTKMSTSGTGMVHQSLVIYSILNRVQTPSSNWKGFPASFSCN